MGDGEEVKGDASGLELGGGVPRSSGAGCRTRALTPPCARRPVARARGALPPGPGAVAASVGLADSAAAGGVANCSS